MFKTENIDLKKFNILTKYPSILTMHKLDNRGNASNVLDVNIDQEKTYYLTEKIDGTNSRIILFPDNRYIIGSREELLTADGDLIYNSNLGVVDTLRPYANKIKNCLNTLDLQQNNILVLYGETFGGHTHKNAVAYSGDQSKTDFRLFDVQRLSISKLNELLLKDEVRIATWREHNNQDWLSVDELKSLGMILNLPVVPYLTTIKGSDIPTNPYEVYSWLSKNIPESQVKLDEQAQGFPEGIIARTIDRSSILKIRNANYKKLISIAPNNSPEI